MTPEQLYWHDEKLRRRSRGEEPYPDQIKVDGEVPRTPCIEHAFIKSLS